MSQRRCSDRHRKANAIDDELGFGISDDPIPIDLPVENAQKRVQQFVENQYQQHRSRR